MWHDRTSESSHPLIDLPKEKELSDHISGLMRVLAICATPCSHALISVLALRLEWSKKHEFNIDDRLLLLS